MSKEAKSTRPEFRCAYVEDGNRCNEALSAHPGYINHAWVAPPEYKESKDVGIKPSKEDQKEA